MGVFIRAPNERRPVIPETTKAISGTVQHRLWDDHGTITIWTIDHIKCIHQWCNTVKYKAGETYYIELSFFLPLENSFTTATPRIVLAPP